MIKRSQRRPAALLIWGGLLVVYVSLVWTGPVHADGALTQQFTISGKFNLAANGVSLRDQEGNKSSGDIELDVPGTPAAAFLYWAGFDYDPGGDNTVDFTVDAGGVTPLLADTTFGPDIWWEDLDTYHYVYRRDITALVQSGVHTYTVSNFNMRYLYGAGLVVVYEDLDGPVNSITILDGLDAAYYKYDPPRGANSEPVTVAFEADASAREMAYTMFVGGVMNESRLSSIWLYSGADVPPADLVDDPAAAELGPLPPPLGAPEPMQNEWDTYSDTLAVPGGAVNAAFQIESVGDEPGYAGASFVWIALGTVVESAQSTLASISGFIWEDENQNGLQDGGETGIEGVWVKRLAAADSSVIDSTQSQGNGLFQFNGITPGDYLLLFIAPDNYYFTSADEGGDDGVDSDADPATGYTDVFSVIGSEIITDIDGGLVPKYVSDLAITKTADRDIVNIGDPVIFTLVVTNLGPDSAADVQVIDDLPAGLDYLSALPAPDNGENPFNWTFDLPADSVQVIEISTRTTAQLGAMDNNAFVSGENHDPDLGNNASSAQIHNFVPVELSAFRAVPAAGQIVLHWTTQSESENLGFHIYRAEEEEGPYVRISAEIIKGAGNSQSARAYSYTDRDVAPDRTYHYQLQDIDFDGRSTMHGPVYTSAGIPDRFTLKQNYPNPFNPVTRIQFSLSEAGACHLTIFNIKGQVVRTLVSGFRQAGRYTVQWDSRDDNGLPVPSGIYFYRLKAGDQVLTRKMGFIK